MNKEQWKETALEIAPHLEAIRQITKRNGMDVLCMDTSDDGCGDAVYIDEDDVHHRLHMHDGAFEIEAGSEVYYQQKLEERPHRPASLGRSNKQSTILSDI